MILAISGKINSGKDAVGEISQIITKSPHFTDEAVLSFLDKEHVNPIFEIKKFGGALKDMICILLGCTREQLEDKEFKEKELGEEWDKWRVHNAVGYIKYYDTEEEGLKRFHDFSEGNAWFTHIKMTPRILLQLLGTECGRNIIHPNIWVNALMSKYKPYYTSYHDGIELFPNWIITDVRFNNELQAVKDKGGISIRVNRWKPISELKNFTLIELKWGKGDVKLLTEVNRYESGRFYNDNAQVILEELVDSYREIQKHESEMALDDATFDYVIDNNGTMLELINKVRFILKEENII